MAVIPVLPRYLAFKGDNNNLLIISKTGKTPMLEYSGAASSLQDMWCVHEVTVVDSATGTVAIRYLGNGLYWQQSYDNPYKQYTIMANLNRLPGSSDKAALFVPVQLTSDIVALRNVEANLFCDRRAYNFLLPRAESIVTTTRMTVADPVLSRNLVDVLYQIDRAVIHSSRLVALGSQTGVNNSSLLGDLSLEIKYKVETTTSWSNSVTVGLGVTVKFNAGVPLVSEGGIEITASVSNETQWGKETTEGVEITGTYTVKDVPPGHRVRVTVSGTEAKCDVPFTYTQLDTLPDGMQRSTSLADGVYTGTNVFNIVFEATDLNAVSQLDASSELLRGEFATNFRG